MLVIPEMPLCVCVCGFFFAVKIKQMVVKTFGLNPVIREIANIHLGTGGFIFL